MAGISVILALLLLSSVKLEGKRSKCERTEKHFAILRLAEESVTIARQIHPSCGDDDKLSNSSSCCENDRVTANLDIALDLMSKAKENYPDCVAHGGSDASNEEYSTPSPSECNNFDKVLEDLLEVIKPGSENNSTHCEPKTVAIDNTHTEMLHKHPMDCSDVLENGINKSGLQRIWLRNRIMKGKGVEVFCDMVTDGGGWTVIQRRGQFGNSEDYFTKTWEEYKHGFGSKSEEFWLGNDKIFALTNQGQYSVRFDMTDTNGTSAFAEYKTFWIENEENKYELHISRYSGNAGDSLSSHRGSHFYTIDHPHQPTEPKSEGIETGGWWLNHIKTTNLNGLNIAGTDKVQSTDGITWMTFGGSHNSLVSTEIKVRPKKLIL